MRLLLALACSLNAQPLHRTLDLNIGEQLTLILSDGSKANIKLLYTNTLKDSLQTAVRTAYAGVEVNGVAVKLACANYQLPISAGGVQIDCPVTKAYYENSNTDHWALEKDARIRLWPFSSPWLPKDAMIYPARQRWFATHTQMANEPTYVDGGEKLSRKKIYYHSGLDIGGAEALTEVIAATNATIVSLGDQVLPPHEKDSPVAKRYDVIYLLDERGWYYRYSHLHSFEPFLKLGSQIKQGQKLGLLGKEGGSGGWSHLHFEIKARQPSGKWGTEEGYAFLWEAYSRQFSPSVIAVARPHRFASVNEKVTLDARRSLNASRYHWTFSDGSTSTEPVLERAYSKPGTYSEILKVTGPDGATAWDFATVNILDTAAETPTIHASFFPTNHLRPGQEITFKVRTFGTTHGEETWDFGDGSPPLTTRSDGNVKMHDPNGYALTRHAFSKPGDYIVRVHRSDAAGRRATTHLWVRLQ
jgi:murein DD-endopeptidase MepM/ murein hydrolase activator NlpD